MKESRLVEWLELGLTDYEQACQLQLDLSRKLAEPAELSGYLLLLEHPPTITFGYSLKGDQARNQLRVSENFLHARGILVYHTDRGGKATYHGPGQLVAYPILKLDRFRFSARDYVGRLEQWAIDWLESVGIAAGRDPQYPGVWVGKMKIASVGVRIEKHVSRHGLAINLWPDLSCFDLIVPCGIPGRKVTSCFELTGKKILYKQAVPGLLSSFRRVFGTELRPGSLDTQMGEGGKNDDQGMADARAV